MRNSTLLCRRDLLWIALQARHLNENLENNLQLESFSVSSVCSVDYYHRILDGIYTEFLSTEHTLSNHRNLNGYFFGFFARFDIQATTG